MSVVSFFRLSGTPDSNSLVKTRFDTFSRNSRRRMKSLWALIPSAR